MESLSPILRNLLLGIAVSATLALTVFKLSGDWRAFESCPNRDVLSWDANLRLIYTLDARDDMVSGHFGRAMLASLRSPTWPPLHGWIAMLVFAVHEPSTVADAGIGFAFYALLSASLLLGGIWIARQEGLPLWTGASAALFAVICLFHTRELTAYSLSAMLETQGMFFFWLTVLALYRAASQPNTGPWYLLLSSVALFLTKFPYGHILIMAVVPAALWKEKERLPRLVGFVFTTYRGKAAILPVVLMLIVAFLVVVRFLPGTPPNVKLFKYIFYGVVCLLFADFNLRLYRQRASLSWIPRLWRQVYIYVCLPILALTLLEPDRFSSTVGTQLHQQDSRRSFLLSIFADFTDSPIPLAILFGGFLLLMLLRLARTRRFELSSMAFAILLIVLHIAILELLTSNKQLRHIYHLMPALLVLLFLATVKAAGASGWPGPAAALLLLLSTGPLVSGEASVFGNAHHSSRYTCWTGPASSMFQPVRDLVALVPADPPSAKKTMLLNDFHRPDAPMPGRVWATDMDLLLRFHLDFKVRNDSRHQWKNWSEFARILHIAASCDGAEGSSLVQSRAADVGVSVQRTTEYSTGQELCITEYRISKSVERQ